MNFKCIAGVHQWRKSEDASSCICVNCKKHKAHKWADGVCEACGALCRHPKYDVSYPMNGAKLVFSGIVKDQAGMNKLIAEAPAAIIICSVCRKALPHEFFNKPPNSSEGAKREQTPQATPPQDRSTKAAPAVPAPKGATAPGGDDGLVRFPCPACGKTLKAARNHAGKKAKCTKCGHSLVVPASPAQEVWTVVSGGEARRLAVEHYVIRDSENFDAAALTFSGQPLPGQVKAAGAIRCHVCSGQVPFEKDFFTAGLSSSRIPCPGCSSQVDLMCTAGHKKDGCFLVASPGTQPSGSRAAKMQMWVTKVGMQTFTPDIPKTPPPPPPPPPAPPPPPPPQVGSRFCNRCETGLSWWSRKMLGGMMNRPGVHTFGSFGAAGGRPAFFAGVCSSCQDGYCNDHATYGSCPKCGGRLTE